MIGKIKEILLKSIVKVNKKELKQSVGSKEVIYLSNEKWDKITHNSIILGSKGSGPVKVYEVIDDIKKEEL